MDDKALSKLVKFLSNTSLEEFDVEGHNELPSSTIESRSSIYENVQIFSDHLKTAKRIKKTFYYGDLLQSNFHPPLALTDATLELFNKTVPNAGRLDILDMDYATTVSKAVCVSPYSMVLAMMYLEQLRHNNPDYLENVSPCDLFVVSILVASKYLFDNDEEFLYNSDWASAANIEVQELNRQEKDFLHAMKWELYTEASDFFEFLSKVEQSVAFKQSSLRGWLSYTDIHVLTRNEIFKEFWWALSGVIIETVVVVTVSYAAAVSVLYGAFTVSYMAQTPARNIIEQLVQHEYTPSVSVIQLSSPKTFIEKDTELVGQNESLDDTAASLQVNHFCARVNEIDANFFPSWPSNIGLGYSCEKNFIFSNHTNNIQETSLEYVNMEKQTELLFLLLSYNNNYGQNLISPPVKERSVVINPKCNYSVSQA